MKYVYATKIQRFVIYLIDFVLLTVVAQYIAYGVETLCGFDRTMMDTYSKNILMELMATSSGKAASTDMLNMYVSKYFQYFMVDLAFKLIFDLILVVVLLILLPKYWGGKTIGRKAMNCKLVDKKGHDATIKHYALRELLGTFVGYCFLGAFFGVVGLISFILILATSKSLPDLISGTCMVVADPIKKEEPKEVLKENEVKPDYTEVKNEETQEEDDDSQDKYSINDDDYKIE
jgi:uncharacterized RDD family membrane protein YckC